MKKPSPSTATLGEFPISKLKAEADLFFAQGFATAQDRLWHMDFDRHQALGRWSEWAGPAGLDRDRLLRAAGMGRTAKLDYEASSPQARAMLDAYAAGVNAFLATTTALPVEYQLLGQSSRAVGKLALPRRVQNAQQPARHL